jgi:hypothetical protein
MNLLDAMKCCSEFSYLFLGNAISVGACIERRGSSGGGGGQDEQLVQAGSEASQLALSGNSRGSGGLVGAW